MATLLFRLKGVPDEEADELRHLLQAEAIDFYETPEGRWGVSMPAIWLRDDEQVERAKQLVETYQHERLARVRREYDAQRESGEIETLFERIKTRPLQVIAAVAAILVILYFVTQPFVNF